MPSAALGLLAAILPTALAQQQLYQPPYAAYDSLQDQQGYVWMAMESGLLRASAHQVRVFTTRDGLPHDHVNSVAAVEDGTLLVGTAGGLVAYSKGRFTPLLQDTVVRLQMLPGNRLWVAGSKLSIGRLDTGGQWRFVAFPQLAGALEFLIDPEEPTGRLWILHQDRICAARLPDLDLALRTQDPARFGIDCAGAPTATALAVDDHNRIVARVDRYLRQFDPVTRRLSAKPLAESAAMFRGGRLVTDRHKRVWIPSTGDALYWANDRLATIPGFVVGSGYLQDRDDTQWISGARYAEFSAWPEAVDPTLPTVTSLARDSRGILFAAGLEVILRRNPESGQWDRIPLEAAGKGHFKGPYLTVRANPSGEGGVHVTSRNSSLVAVDSHGQIRSMPDTTNYGSLHLAVDASGSLWLTTKIGLFQAWLEKARYRYSQVPLPNGQERVRAVSITPSGDVVVGWGKGVAVLRDGEVIFHRDRASGLLEDPLQCLTADDRQIWVGYDNERAFSRILYRDPGAPILHFTSERGYRSPGTVTLHLDRRGWIWRGAADGIFVADGKRLEPDQWHLLSQKEGRPLPGQMQNSVFEDQDGSLWFGTETGIVHYHPPADLFDRLRTPSTVALTAIAYDSQPATIAELAPTELQGGGHSVQFHYSALHYANPQEHRYRYRLWPRQKEWITTDQFQVTYPDLPHGDYRFEVHGIAENRAWSTTPATFAFTLQAPFYATTWFLGSTGTVSLAGLFFLLRRYRLLRQRRLREQRIKQLFLTALDLAPAARSAFVDAAAATEPPEVAAQLRSMLENAEPGDPTAESRLLPIGDVFEHRFEIERWIGSGGFSHVYLARDRKLSGRLTAIKIHQSRHAAQPELVAQLRRETETLVKLDHPHIVDIYDTGVTPDGRLFLAMEYIDGPSLRQLGPLAPRRVAALIRQLAEAVSAAHATGIIHRDLKPGNLLLRHPGTPQEHLIVIDFGLATPTGAATQPMLAATPDYMAPEQQQGRAYPATDVYAMALIAFELLTGKRCATILRDGGSLADHLDSALATVMQSALRMNPASRPSPLQFAETVARALD